MNRGRCLGVPTLAGAFLLSACTARFDPAHFEGTRELQRAEPEALLELGTRSSELEELGTVHASCTLQPGFRRLVGEPLSDLDCSTQRLSFALRESAANAGGEALIGLHCSSRRSGETYRVNCGATVARFSTSHPAGLRPLSVPRSTAPGTPAPSASDVTRIDEPDVSLAFRISVSFEPRVTRFQRRSRRSAEVTELSLMPLADQPLGELIASCENGCDERALRHGVLVAAGRLGAPAVISMRCFSDSSGDSCVGTLAAPEREE